jgi:N-acetylmuramic acid 6-phosphate etherase
MTRTSTGPRAAARPAAARFVLAAAIFAALLVPAAGRQGDVGLLKLLGITAPPESLDYVVDKTPFQLHTLLTEQRHPKTWTLSEKIASDTEAGLRMLFAVDEDVAARLESLAGEKVLLGRLVTGIEYAVLGKKKIYVYGCGATGRLAKQMESSFWRPFWKKVQAESDLWAKVLPSVGPSVGDRLVGEMTGADRALISSLEGFEDLQLIGRLQLADRGVKRGDFVICVTEGGETSSVIGTILGALDQWRAEAGFDPRDSRKSLYFVYNNPNDRLMPFERSRKVLEADGITKINLTTGPQAITGSTRMQATTIETYVVAAALETAVERVLRRSLSKKEMARLGFAAETGLDARLRRFPAILQEIKKNIPAIARLTNLEAKAYADDRFSTYFAKAGLITVFIDSTERSPTFRLYPLDTVAEPARKCWIQVWTDAPDAKSAWQAFLGRPFRGLNPDIYRKPFEEQIEDPYLGEKALASLGKAGDGQALLYDFSFGGANLKKRAPKAGDVAVAALMGDEIASLKDPASAFRRFADLAAKSSAGLGLLLLADKPGGAPDARSAGATGSRKPRNAGGPGSREPAKGALAAPELWPATGPAKAQVVTVRLEIADDNDPFGLDRHIALKMLLNAHSTAVMAKLGKVVGNTMTSVSPTNLKLIGRATYLIQLHVNDILAAPGWVRQNGVRKSISYGEANVVLFDAIAFMNERTQDVGQAAEVPLSIVRILESLRQKRGLSADEALEIVRKPGLAAYLAGLK